MALAAVNIETAVVGTIDFNARDATLNEIFRAIKENFEIEVKGLEDLAGKKISFSYKAETTEDLLKSLLRHLGIKNYAFEFADATLKRLVVVPGAVNAPSTTTRSPVGIGDQDEFASVARIQSIVEGSQAESAGLQKGDYILEYDGTRISSAQQLVREVEKKISSSQVELLVVRQKIPSRLILNGGFIGVRVTTQKIPRSEYEVYLGGK
jgi:S1-C subfamily serine protease